ncbi:MAG: DUF6259 domain-containing protein [Firmicutes bacterium]|nr:DUF6259 domain-containing protein [Bacillota bacterium]
MLVTDITFNHEYHLTLDEHRGALLSLSRGSREFLARSLTSNPLFRLRFRVRGRALDLSSDDARNFSIVSNPSKTLLTYQFLNDLPIHVMVNLTASTHESLTYWYLSVENQTDYILEWIEFPGVVVPNDLVATGGTSRIVWPAMEGTLVEDAELREHGWLKYRDPGYPSKGWEGIYPGPCAAQFMAYYRPDGGLYLGAHDPHGHVKSIEYRSVPGGVRLQFRLFADGFGRGTYCLDYPMVMGIFDGDWHDAADIYRTWFLQSSAQKYEHLRDSEHRPAWFAESPVTVIYPVRGSSDTGSMEPNEYFPYTRALPHLRRLSEQLDSKIMALLMHWEGTAPWAPPYVWPPYGGTEQFREFVRLAHDEGFRVGVYGSGIGWTQESLLVPKYHPPYMLNEHDLKQIMCTAPDGEVGLSNICAGAQRLGYDMCPSNPFVATTTISEVTNIAASGVDYIQFFDQNLGGLSYACYSAIHGHPPGPGQWQTDAMINLFQQISESSTNNVVLGCEAAAAEPFIAYLRFNDLRYNIALWAGYPIPLYQYLYHEYINNFMGNQNSSSATIDIDRSPYNLLWRTAYAFVSGEMLAVVLKDRGQINWDWGTPWTAPGPNQDLIIQLIRNLNPWRTSIGRPYLMYGRMLKPFPVTVSSTQTFYMRAGHQLEVPSVLTSRWHANDGTEAQFLVNYTPDIQTVKVDVEGFTTAELKLYGLTGEEQPCLVNAAGTLFTVVPPLSCLMIKMAPFTAGP